MKRLITKFLKSFYTEEEWQKFVQATPKQRGATIYLALSFAGLCIAACSTSFWFALVSVINLANAVNVAHNNIPGFDADKF